MKPPLFFHAFQIILLWIIFFLCKTMLLILCVELAVLLVLFIPFFNQLIMVKNALRQTFSLVAHYWHYITNDLVFFFLFWFFIVGNTHNSNNHVLEVVLYFIVMVHFSFITCSLCVYIILLTKQINDFVLISKPKFNK